MNSSFISIYFNLELGYIITSYTKYINGGPNRVMNPVQKLNFSANYEQLGNAVLEGLEKTRTAERVNPEELQGFKFWQTSGIKGFSTFSKKFRMLDIEKDDKQYVITERKRDSKGAYVFSKDDLTLELSVDATPEAIGKVVAKMLSNEIVIQNDLGMTFITVNDSVLSYTRPSDVFIDIGDGHTDAYQIYTHEDNEENNIMFVIDNLYDDTIEKTIKSQWERWYGELKEFQYRKVDEDTLKIKVCGKTDKEEINSYLYRDGDALMEVSAKLDFTNTSVEKQKNIKEEFKKVIDSIRILAK